jgi:hypothetical protein
MLSNLSSCKPVTVLTFSRKDFRNGPHPAYVVCLSYGVTGFIYDVLIVT